MGIGKDIFDLQKKIEYTFSDVSYLERALTHSSFSYEMKNKGIRLPSNERLEFLGDAVLEFVISEYIFEKFGDFREGVLTKMRQFIVCESSLSEIARSISLGEYLNLGKGEENDGRSRVKILADALEALIAAVYLDSRGKSPLAVKRLILELFSGVIEKSIKMQRGDYKTMLQELVEKDGSLLEYELILETGPEHDKSFSVAALVNNNVVGKGLGKTKKDAEMAAAKEALQLFGVSV